MKSHHRNFSAWLLSWWRDAFCGPITELMLHHGDRQVCERRTLYHLYNKLWGLVVAAQWSRTLAPWARDPGFDFWKLLAFQSPPKIGPPWKRSQPPFLNEVIAEDACSRMYSESNAVSMLNREHWRTTLKRVGLTNEVRHYLLLLHKQVHDRNWIAKGHVITLENTPPPFEKPLKFITQGVFTWDYRLHVII